MGIIIQQYGIDTQDEYDWLEVSQSIQLFLYLISTTKSIKLSEDFGIESKL